MINIAFFAQDSPFFTFLNDLMIILHLNHGIFDRKIKYSCFEYAIRISLQIHWSNKNDLNFHD